MQQAYSRSVKLLGEESFARLHSAHVLVVGLGGVGGAAAEVFARSGVGALTLVDGDKFEPSNLNRQLLCTASNIGEDKAIAAVRRVRDIDPDIAAKAVTEFVTADNIDKLLSGGYSYCVDAIDDIRNKTLLIKECKIRGIPIVSAMGAGNRIDCGFTVKDVYKTEYDPLARKLRHELRNAGVTSLDVVCATASPLIKSATPASIAAPPLVMGAMLANFVVLKLIGGDND